MPPASAPFGRPRRQANRAFRSFSQMRVRRQARGCPDRPAFSSLSANGRTNGDAGKSTPTPHRSGSRPAPPICGLACTRRASRKSVMILTGTRAADKRRPQLLPLNGRRKLIGAKHASPLRRAFLPNKPIEQPVRPRYSTQRMTLLPCTGSCDGQRPGGLCCQDDVATDPLVIAARIRPR